MTIPNLPKKYPFQTFNIQLVLQENLITELEAVRKKQEELTNQLMELKDYEAYLRGIQEAAEACTVCTAND